MRCEGIAPDDGWAILSNAAVTSTSVAGMLPKAIILSANPARQVSNRGQRFIAVPGYRGRMSKAAAPVLASPRIECPSCHVLNAVHTYVRHGRTNCDHSWDDPPREPRAPSGS
jgi:hypothetical protein